MVVVVASVVVVVVVVVVDVVVAADVVVVVDVVVAADVVVVVDVVVAADVVVVVVCFSVVVVSEIQEFGGFRPNGGSLHLTFLFAGSSSSKPSSHEISNLSFAFGSP